MQGQSRLIFEFLKNRQVNSLTLHFKLTNLFCRILFSFCVVFFQWQIISI